MNQATNGRPTAPTPLTALKELFALHEPEGRFQPSHYKPVLRRVAEAIEAEEGGGLEQHRARYHAAAERHFSDFAARVLTMARSVKGKPFLDWPGWSTGECLAVALVLNDPVPLEDLGYTMLQAFDRLDGELNLAQLRAIAKAV